MATLWQLYHGDLLDVPADVLVCSANVYLTLSGGVGGAFSLRYGAAMQGALYEFLANRDTKYVEPGEVVTTGPCGSPYRAVLHAVAVDAFYETSLDVVTKTIATSLQRAAHFGARTVALTALATGYGRQSIEFFGHALENVIDHDFQPVERVVVGLKHRADVDELRAVLPGVGMAS